MVRPPKLTEPTDHRLSADQMRAGIERINKRIAALEAFDPTSVTDQYTTPELDALEVSIKDALSRTFGAQSRNYGLYHGAASFDRGPYNSWEPVHPSQFQASIAKSKLRALALLNAAVSSLDEQLQEQGGQDKLGASDGALPKPTPSSTKVFVVHGHDEGAKQSVARLLEKLDLEPVILHEQPNKGRTTIDKFRQEAAEIGFAVVLMTPDDHGAKVGEPAAPRARQNVIFELGFFIGALGPHRVAALLKGGVERPSDYEGVVYISLENGSWQIDLAKELRAVGYAIDMNKLF